jgi:hypothetical protein
LTFLPWKGLIRGIAEQSYTTTGGVSPRETETVRDRQVNIAVGADFWRGHRPSPAGSQVQTEKL